MPTLTIQGTELSYNDTDIINFPEGLIGLSHLRKMVMVKQSAIEPFMWLVSLDDERVAFVVTDSQSLFPGYAPVIPEDSPMRNVLGEDETPIVLAIVLVAPEWHQSTVNLRAPLFVSASTMTGSQIVLNDNRYSVGEPLPFAIAA